MFERKSQKLVPVRLFLRRMAISLLLAAGLAGIALVIGILGYHTLAGLNWVDSILDASMILGGMGPVSELHNDSAKLFAAAYALFSGLVFIGIMGITLSPILHRMLHHFHLADEDENKEEKPRGKPRK